MSSEKRLIMNNHMPHELKNIDSWKPISMQKAAANNRNNVQEIRKPVRFINNGRLSPLTLYCYLQARFGPPNGSQMLFKNPNDSDNLIHWHYNIIAGTDTLEILGVNTRVEFWAKSNHDLTEQDWNEIINCIKSDFENHGKALRKARNNFEHWHLFINPFNRLKNIVEQGKSRLKNIDLKHDVPMTCYSEFDPITYGKTLETYINNISDAAFICTNLRMLAPLYAEAFLNLLIFILAKEEINSDDRLYQDLIRKQIDIKVKNLPMHCHGFISSPSDSAEPFKDFLRLMNNRNDVLHGNINPKTLKFDEVWFDGYTPLFKDDKIFGATASYHSLKHIEPDDVLSDIKTVELFIDYILSLLEEKVRWQAEQIMTDPYPGWREDTNTVGKLFANAVVDIVPISHVL
jgi:hypothetical protein